MFSLLSKDSQTFYPKILAEHLNIFPPLNVWEKILNDNTVIPYTEMHALKYLELDAALNTLFGHFWITVLMPHLKPETLV